MGCIMNGFAYYGLFRPSGATFLVFADYMRAAVRIAALAELPVSYIWTHDSIGVGEDGPTHQPVETVSGLRAFPNLDVFRPADYEETADLKCIIIATGSELQHAVAAAKQIGGGVRVVSMPCMERFDRQSDAYKAEVLPDSCRKRVAREAGVSTMWYKYVGLDSKVIGVDRFGFSAPGDIVMSELGMTADNCAKEVFQLLQEGAIIYFCGLKG